MTDEPVLAPAATPAAPPATTGRAERAATIYDVAEAAGVSITTVSNALNKPARVAPSTLTRVLAAADELGFTPKAAAVSYARRGFGRIGVIAPFSSYDSFRIRLTGVLSACVDQPVEVVVFDHESAAEATSPLLGSLPVAGRLDGLLIMGIPLEDELVERLAQRNLPTVLVDSFHRHLPSVNVDDERGGQLLAEHLLGSGHRSFAYVSERQQSTQFVSASQRRLAGFTRTLAAAGIDESGLQRVITSHDVAGGRAAATAMAESTTRPDAVVAHFDEIAAGLLTGFRRAGVGVPDEIAVAGYDDGPLAEAMEITTVRQPLAETGRAGAEFLLEAIAGHDKGLRQLILSPTLVPRTSA